MSPQHKQKVHMWQLHQNHLFGWIITKCTAYEWQTHLHQMMNHFSESSYICYYNVLTWLVQVAQVFTSQTGCIYRLDGRTVRLPVVPCAGHTVGMRAGPRAGLVLEWTFSSSGTPSILREPPSMTITALKTITLQLTNNSTYQSGKTALTAFNQNIQATRLTNTFAHHGNS